MTPTASQRVRGKVHVDAFGIGKESKATHPADGKPTTKNPALLDAKAGLPAQFDGLVDSALTPRVGSRPSAA